MLWSPKVLLYPVIGLLSSALYTWGNEDVLQIILFDSEEGKALLEFKVEQPLSTNSVSLIRSKGNAVFERRRLLTTPVAPVILDVYGGKPVAVEVGGSFFDLRHNVAYRAGLQVKLSEEWGKIAESNKWFKSKVMPNKPDTDQFFPKNNNNFRR